MKEELEEENVNQNILSSDSVGSGEEMMLFHHLREMINNKNLGDVVLTTLEGDHVWACKALLAARSSFFRSKLLNNDSHLTTEGKQQLNLPTIKKEALLCVLEFLYTENLRLYRVGLNNVFDVIHAARHLMIPSLEQEALDFFQNQDLKDLESDLGCVPELLSEAVERLSPVSVSDMARIFRPMLDIVHISLKNVCKFSQQGLVFFLQNTRGSSVDFSDSEYMRFCSVLAWCGGSISPAVYDTILQCLPVPEAIWCLDEDIDDFEFEISIPSFSFIRDMGPSVILVCPCPPKATSLSIYHSVIQTKFASWLTYIDMFRIPPSLLIDVIEPFDIVPDVYLLKVFQFQSIRSEIMASQEWTALCPWHHNQIEFSISLDSFIIRRPPTSDPNCATVVSNFSITPLSRRMFEWEILIEEGLPGPLFGIGFMNRSQCGTVRMSKQDWLTHNSSIWLGQKPYGWVLTSSGHLLHKGVMSDKRYAPRNLKEGDIVRVCLDMKHFTCSFVINGMDCGLAWEDIPNEVWPAVEIDASATLRIEMMAGEDRKQLSYFLNDTLFR